MKLVVARVSPDSRCYKAEFRLLAKNRYCSRGKMLSKALVDKFYYVVRSQGFNDADIAWILKQLGAGAVEELHPKDAFRIESVKESGR